MSQTPQPADDLPWEYLEPQIEKQLLADQAKKHPPTADEQLQAIATSLRQTNTGVSMESEEAVIDRAVHQLQKLMLAERKQGGLNALTQLKQDRINHTLSTPVKEWTREVELIDQHILSWMQQGQLHHQAEKGSGT